MTVKRLSRQSRIAVAVRLLGLGMLFLLAACGSGNEKSFSKDSTSPTQRAQSAAPASGGAIDPCTLVLNAEAEKALGAPVAEAERPQEANIPPRLVTCRYTGRRGQGVAVMTVMVRMGQDADESRLGFQSAKGQFTEVQAVPGIGDDAFWIGNQLNILRDDFYLIIGGDFDLDTAKALGQTALERLP